MTQPHENTDTNTGTNPDILVGLFQTPIDDSVLNSYELATDTQKRLVSSRARFNHVAAYLGPNDASPDEIESLKSDMDEAVAIADKLIGTFRKIVKQGYIHTVDDLPVLNENLRRQSDLSQKIDTGLNKIKMNILSS